MKINRRRESRENPSTTTQTLMGRPVGKSGQYLGWRHSLRALFLISLSPCLDRLRLCPVNPAQAVDRGPEWLPPPSAQPWLPAAFRFWRRQTPADKALLHTSQHAPSILLKLFLTP